MTTAVHGQAQLVQQRLYSEKARRQGLGAHVTESGRRGDEHPM